MLKEAREPWYYDEFLRQPLEKEALITDKVWKK